MKTIRLTIDEGLLEILDLTVQELGTNRSCFIPSALESALRQHVIEQLEERHAAGYKQKPADDAEVLEWTSEQIWDEKYTH